MGEPYNLLRAFKNQGSDDTASLITYEQFKLALRAVAFTPQAMSDDQFLMMFQRRGVSHDSCINCQDFVKKVMVSGNAISSNKEEGDKPNALWHTASDFREMLNSFHSLDPALRKFLFAATACTDRAHSECY